MQVGYPEGIRGQSTTKQLLYCFALLQRWLNEEVMGKVKESVQGGIVPVVE